ncbi:hypothetical protein C8R43DRAFT_908184, partial [Mycena crocata]
EPFGPTDHCIEMLRQNSMCTADVGMITYEWVKNWSNPYPDFSHSVVFKTSSFQISCPSEQSG